MKNIILGLILLPVIIFASNPLDEYITDKVYNQGISEFPKGNNIFREKVYSMANIKKERQEAINKLKSTFTKISFISKNAMGNWIVTFYYKNSEGRSTRKTIEGPTKLEVGDASYYLNPYSSGLKIKELKTDYEYNLEKAGR